MITDNKTLYVRLFIGFRGLLRIAADRKLAEKAGFEPAVRFEPYTRFPGVHLQPLGHFSIKTFQQKNLHHDGRARINQKVVLSNFPAAFILCQSIIAYIVCQLCCLPQ